MCNKEYFHLFIHYVQRKIRGGGNGELTLLQPRSTKCQVNMSYVAMPIIKQVLCATKTKFFVNKLYPFLIYIYTCSKKLLREKSVNKNIYI